MKNNTHAAKEETKKMMVIQPAVPTDESAEDTETSYMASDMYQRIVALINNFEADLPADGSYQPVTLRSAFRTSATGIPILLCFTANCPTAPQSHWYSIFPSSTCFSSQFPDTTTPKHRAALLVLQPKTNRIRPKNPINSANYKLQTTNYKQSCYHNPRVFQKLLRHMTRTVNISKRPTSMDRHKIPLENIDSSA